jgi:SAM-dependent methyltransferase
MHDEEFFRTLYEDKDEYVSRRDPNSPDARRILLETMEFKIPNLRSVIPADFHYDSIIEIGCATGELIGEFPRDPTRELRSRIGFDISPSNVAAARKRYPDVEFRDDDFRQWPVRADLVILSDVLEHVPEDVTFLSAAARLGRLTLVNLPLESNWLNLTRNYGPADVSGHLRRYSLRDGMQLFARAGLMPLIWRREWIHMTPCEAKRRALRLEVEGAEYGGGPFARSAKAALMLGARFIEPFGKRLLASNLFASLRPTDPLSAAR